MQIDPKRLSKEEHKEVMKGAFNLLQRNVLKWLIFFLTFSISGIVLGLAIEGSSILIFPIFFIIGSKLAIEADTGEKGNYTYNLNLIKPFTFTFVAGVVIVDLTMLGNYRDHLSFFSNIVNDLEVNLTNVIITYQYLNSGYIVGGYLVFSEMLFVALLILFHNLQFNVAMKLSYDATTKNNAMIKQKMTFLVISLAAIYSNPLGILFSVVFMLFFPCYTYCLYRAIFLNQMTNKEEKMMATSKLAGSEY